MKKVFKFMSIVLLCSAFCVACEKEEAMNAPQTIIATESAEMDARLREAYAAAYNDAPLTIVVPSVAANAYRDRCIEMFGSSVSIAMHENDMAGTTHITIIANHTLLAKKIWQKARDTKAAYFSSKDRTEVDQWGADMKKEGYYQVIVTVDENGVYHGVAYTEEEWKELNS